MSGWNLARPRIAAAAEREGTLPYFLAWPAPSTPSRGLMVLVHGRSRSARPLIEAFAGGATDCGYTVLAPVFEQTRYAGYQRLAGVVGPTAAADALRRTTAEVQRAAGGEPAPIVLVGFSGGAQFAHRFALAHPLEVAQAVVAAAGWYTMPDPQTAYPHGLASSPSMPGGLPDLDAFLALPVRVMVGERDVARDANLNTTPAIDEMQGRHRLERARRWVSAVRAAAEAHGLASSTALELLPGTGHSVREAIGRGDLVARTLRFLAERAP